MQNLLWGVGQPFAGGVADRFGVVAGAQRRRDPLRARPRADGLRDDAGHARIFRAGVLIGFGLSGCSFNLVIGALGKLVPESWRSLAFGAGTAAGSFGQFLFSPLGAVPDRRVSAGRRRCWSSAACCC